MAKKALIIILIACILATVLSINTFADDNLSVFDNVFKEVEKKLWAGEQVEGKIMTGIASGGDPIYTTYPTITDAMIKPLIANYIQKLKDQIIKLGPLSQTEIKMIIDIYKNFDYHPIYSWSGNNVIMSIYPEPDLNPIVEAREKAATQTAADAFFKDFANKPSSWARPDVQQAIETGIVPEALQRNYQQPITREEFASLFVRTVFTWQEKERSNEPEYQYTKEEFLTNVKAIDYNFKDVDNPDVKAAYLMGFVNGVSDTAFAPSKEITRQEAAVMLVNYFQYTLYIDSGYSLNIISDINKAALWAKNALIMSYYNELITGTNSKKDKNGDVIAVDMNPLGYFTREQAIVTANRFYQKNKYIQIPLMVRGTVYFDPSIEYEVSKNSVTAVRLNERYFRREKGIIAKNLLTYAPFRTSYSINKAEQVEAMTIGVNDLAFMLKLEMDDDIVYDIMEWTGHGYAFPPFPPPYTSERKVVDALFSGKNHLIDLGWSTVEINGAGFIYKYNLRNNGFHTYHNFWVKDILPAVFKLVK